MRLILIVQDLMNLLWFEINKWNPIPIKKENHWIALNIEHGVRLHKVAHVDAVLWGILILLCLELQCPILLHVKLVYLLATLIVDNIDLATDRGYQKVLAHSLFGNAVDAVDHLWLAQLEAAGWAEGAAFLVGDLDWQLGVCLSKDVGPLGLRREKRLLHFVKTRVGEVVAEVKDLDASLFKAHGYVSFKLTKIDICF